jgi:type IV pilus assembly protein PilN
MVKINLLAEGKRPVIARKAKQPLLQFSGVNAANWALFGVSVLAIALALGWYLVLEGKLKRKNSEIRVAQREVDELKPVIQEVEAYEKKLKDLNRKVEVITTLKDNQRGPVRIMDEVSRGLPELLWLTNMDVTASSIAFRGTAYNMSAVANFIDNLDKVEAFREPVLQDATRVRGQRGRAELYNFRMSVAYSFKRPAAPTAEGGQAGAPAASAGAE